MTTGGWLVMVLAVGGITSLLGWCIYMVISTPEAPEHLHSQADIEPDDIERE